MGGGGLRNDDTGGTSTPTARGQARTVIDCHGVSHMPLRSGAPGWPAASTGRHCSGGGHPGGGDIVVDDVSATRSFDLSISDPANLDEAIAFLSVRTEFIGDPDRLKRILLEHCTDLQGDRYHQGVGLPNLSKMLLER